MGNAIKLEVPLDSLIRVYGDGGGVVVTVVVTPPRNRGGAIFSLQFVCVCVCACVCTSVCLLAR